MILAALLLNPGCGKSWGKFWVPVAFTPTSGPVGTLIRVTAANLDFSSATQVTVGGTAAVIVSQSSSVITVFVMPGSSTGSVAVTYSEGVATSGESFSITTAGIIGAQQGNKLVGTGNVGAARQGSSVAVSADGNTMIMGGTLENALASPGAAWVFTRNGTTWAQQGEKLVGTGNVGNSAQGSSVALSADGNTAVVGGSSDDGGKGAIWIFTRSGTTWTQQGSKLVGSDKVGNAGQGVATAISADGNTVISGAANDNGNIGAAWIFTRSGTTWAQQGAKLVGTNSGGTIFQGFSVGISADSNTAIVGGPFDSGNIGATWVFTRSGTTWTEQGPKLVGTGNVGNAQQGYSVAISADGNTIIEGAPTDNTDVGAAWIFIRTGSTWSQQGGKFFGSGATSGAIQSRVAISADGNTALLATPNDNSFLGAMWVFTRSGTSWTQRGAKLAGTGSIGSPVEQGIQVALSADASTAILGGWKDNTNHGAAWVFVP